MHKASQIRDAIYTTLNGLVGTSEIKEVIKGAEPAQEFPAVSVLVGDDTPATRNNAFIDWELTVYVDIFIRDKSVDVDALMLGVRKDLHKAIMADPTQGLSFVTDTMPLGQQEPDRSSEGDQYSSATRTSWQVSYRSSVSDPSL